jgi:hypothetical protein
LTTNIQESAFVTSVQQVINFIDRIKNTEITDETLHELLSRFQTCVDIYNLKPLIAFPVKIVAEPIDKITFEIRSTCFSRFKFSEVHSVIDRLRQVENLDDGQCLDVICVLIDYSNIVIYPRFDHGLALEPKKIDDWKSSSGISTHLEMEMTHV